MVSRLYPILDVDCLRATCEQHELMSAIRDFASQLFAAGVTILQYRERDFSSREVLSQARELRRVVPRSVKLIMNGRADLSLAAGYDGVHVEQDYLSPASVRQIIGHDRFLGVSAHTLAQFAEVINSPADYLAVGPIFSATSTFDSVPVVGLNLVRAARKLLSERNDSRPLVAFGGVTRANAAEVFAAGANSVAVMSDLVTHPSVSAEAFLAILL